MDHTAPLPNKVAAVERWLLGEFRLYTQQPTRTKAAGKISGPTKLLETWELKKKKKMKEIKRERTKERKTSKTNLMLSLGIGAFLAGHSSVEK